MTSSGCPSMDSLFGPDGLFARGIDGYEFRSGQLEMARTVARLLAPDAAAPEEGCSSLVVEAETLTQVKDWAASDPYKAADLFASVEVIEWKKVIG